MERKLVSCRIYCKFIPMLVIVIRNSNNRHSTVHVFLYNDSERLHKTSLRNNFGKYLNFNFQHGVEISLICLKKLGN